MRGVRQHVNPLGWRYIQARSRPVSRPPHLSAACSVEVELGCADGQFSFDLARSHPSKWVVGLEIREKLVERNRARARREGLGNLGFAYVNLNVDLDRVFEADAVDRFHLLFPDPWFKSRHQKRRVLDIDLCAVLRRQLRAGGELHVATDVFELALDAMDCLERPEAQALGFRNLAGSWSFCRRSPTRVTSRREDTTLERGDRVWRLRYGVGGSVGASRSRSGR